MIVLDSRTRQPLVCLEKLDRCLTVNKRGTARFDEVEPGLYSWWFRWRATIN
ncbi:MAG: hypothetical protein GF344_16670 [Chitinivibrionales bacterium]|nr:hypothetical protein [Chitinivibrionales bacterium]